MMLRRALITVAALGVLAGAGLLAPAAAAPPARQGWWRATLEVLGIDLSAVLDPSSVDVPADGLLVAGGSSFDQPQAYAAVAYDLTGVTLAGPLRLELHPTAASIPQSVAVACPLDIAAFAPARGGRVADGPKYDCLGGVPATIAADGAYLFDLSTLQREDTVAIALLPGNPTSRIVFAPPGDDSLPVTAAAAPVAPSPAAAATAPEPAPSAFSGGGASAPVEAVPSSPAAVPSESGGVPAPAGFATPLPSGSDNGSAGRAYVLLVLAAVAGAAWTFAGRPRHAAAEAGMTGALHHHLAQWVKASTGAPISDVSVIGKGSSRRTWGVELTDGRRVVVREDTGAGPMAGTPLDLRREATVYRALTGRGLSVPALLGVAPDGSAILLEHAPGTADLKTAGAGEQAAVARDYLHQLGRLHLLDPGRLELGALGVPEDGPSHALVDIGLWRSIQASIPERWSSPAARFGLEWLAAHPPAEATRTSLCHGDAGPLNFLHEAGQVTAMVDWEFAHVGDPVDDLAWVAVRNQVLRSGIDLASVFAVWRETTGSDIDPDRLEYYRALVLARMLVSCDATMRWTDGVETGDNRTQVVLRPFLARAICQALRRAGCDAAGLGAVEDEAERAWSSSPLVAVFGPDPILDELGAAVLGRQW